MGQMRRAADTNQVDFEARFASVSCGHLFHGTPENTRPTRLQHNSPSGERATAGVCVTWARARERMCAKRRPSFHLQC